MQIQRSQNISFGAKQSVMGNFSEAARTRLANQLSAIGDDKFTHYVDFNKSIISTNSTYDYEKTVSSLSGPIQILRGEKDTDADIVKNLVDLIKRKVEFFKQTQKGIMD